MMLLMLTGGALVERYTKWMQAAGRADNTITERVRQARWIVASVDPHTCGTRDLLTLLARPGWAPATRASHRAGVRCFFRWMADAGLREDNPAERLPGVRQPPPHPHPASEDALRQARASARNPHERLMVELAARAGLRRAEIASLQFSNLEREPDGQYVLRVTGKGRRTRTVPIPMDLAHAILDLRVDWVFPSRFAGRHMSPNWIGQRLSQLLGPTASAHDLRHRYATRVYSGSCDLLALQQLLGHSSPATTQVYVRRDMDDLRRAATAAT